MSEGDQARSGRGLEIAVEWREGFEAMGKDPECSNVEYAIHAQAEVVLGDY